MAVRAFVFWRASWLSVLLVLLRLRGFSTQDQVRPVGEGFPFPVNAVTVPDRLEVGTGPEYRTDRTCCSKWPVPSLRDF